MAILQRGADLFYTFRFIKLLVTRWENTDAHKLGIIDANGKPLKRVADLNTPDEKSAYTMFHRLVYNIKRLINKIPVVGRTTLASWAAAIWLIKEETGMSEKAVISILEKYCKENDIEFDKNVDLSESNNWFIAEDKSLPSGSYQLVHDIASPKTGELIAKAGSNVLVKENVSPSGSVAGSYVYQVEHIQTRQKIYITTSDILK